MSVWRHIFSTNLFNFCPTLFRFSGRCLLSRVGNVLTQGFRLAGSQCVNVSNAKCKSRNKQTNVKVPLIAQEKSAKLRNIFNCFLTFYLGGGGDRSWANLWWAMFDLCCTIRIMYYIRPMIRPMIRYTYYFRSIWEEKVDLIHQIGRGKRYSVQNSRKVQIQNTNSIQFVNVEFWPNVQYFDFYWISNTLFLFTTIPHCCQHQKVSIIFSIIIVIVSTTETKYEDGGQVADQRSRSSPSPLSA